MELGQRVDGSSVTTFRIALKQSNLEHGYDYLMDVPHPKSSNYGRHWTAEEVRQMFSPSRETVDAVNAWLASNGLQHGTEQRGHLLIDIPVADAERLFEEWVADEEKKAPSRFDANVLRQTDGHPPPLGHIFIKQVLDILLPPSSTKLSHAPKVVKYLLERRAVSDCMVEGGLIPALLLRQDLVSLPKSPSSIFTEVSINRHW